ncbi:replicative DNA helicase [Mycoplasma capricolum]|uniref:Replicative DNA helicase n=1 Tax=Mycoplasma capricolum subsp. capripneumoniae 87001 TaxID=1124992 RepID=A0A9N7G870_MYCCC|nr:replicative DNA helicase [Mycoplasma capricolum]AJK51127.1 DNA helicase [Mycoplasma capricolum subsp. capripneumoniae 87001]AOQ21868.1 replicative DNA helicase [Mycoplasma capricolum subsp. capripneumoniae M1601]AQU77297.1 replicative DNA helicase [Mycoplasma capricolum subsp. capripneumoniae]MCK8461558.1 replicative DNA helicase [Mycoplasma capricolum subsp. capricolum]QIN42133.1 replicative DNA helicase [Mycoplasma capricolum subsp. capripneumoniae]
MKKELSITELLYAERFVLGVAMSFSNALADIISVLKVDDFSIEANKYIYQAIIDLNSKNKSVSPISVINRLEAINKLDRVGGDVVVYEIAAENYTDQGLEEYIDVIHKSGVIRKLDAVIKELELKRNSGNTDIDELLKVAQTKLLDIDLSIKRFEIEAVGDVAKRVVEKIKELEMKAEIISGVPTGYNYLDLITSGWQESDFIILAARPSVGKTAFSLNLAFNAAMKKYPVAFFSLEMPAEQLTQRLFTRLTSIDSTNLRTGKGLSKLNWERIQATKEKLEDIPIYIDATPGISTQEIRSKLYKMKRDHDIKLCVIDYLQLIVGSQNKDRQNEVSEISRQLKQIARETSIPIICLSQLSRRAETREDKRPMLSDLRDSGAIEQDADIVAFLYRDDYYKKDQSDNQSNLEKEKTELILAKHRNGATGTVFLRFIKDFGVFRDW